MSIIGQNILAGASGGGAYTIDQSCRFDPTSTSYLHRTPATAGDQKTWTFSTWAKRGNMTTAQYIFAMVAGYNNTGWFTFEWRTDGGIHLVPGYGYNQYKSTELFRDPAAWYHLCLRCDTTQSTWATRLRLYVNGVSQTIIVSSTDSSGEPAQDAIFGINDDAYHTLGKYQHGTNYLEGYLAEIHHVDGQSLAPTSFAETNEDTNQWVPKKYEGTYGTNGFYLKFEASADLGNDSSGSGNDWTPSGLVATVQLTDTPSNNFPTMNPLINPYTGITYTEGNLQLNKAANSWGQTGATMSLPNSGKWYWEINRATASGTGMMGVAGSEATNVFNSANTAYLDTVATFLFYDDAKKYIDGTATTYGATWYDANMMAIALNLDDNEITLYKNNVSEGTVSITGGVLISNVIIPVDILYGTEERDYNFGQNGTFNGAKTAQGNTDANGIGDFFYAPPAGFLAICTSNLSDPSITLPAEHFNTITWSGSGGDRDITGVGFDPNLMWSKIQDYTYPNLVVDTLRGAPQSLITNTTAAEQAGDANGTLDAFITDGFSTVSGGATNYYYNRNGYTYVAWNWLASTTFDPTTAGTISTAAGRSNVAAGFSIVTYTGNNTSPTTIGHGLSEAPEMIITKRRNATGTWFVHHTDLTNYAYYLGLNDSSAQTGNAEVYAAAPTASVYSIGNVAAINENAYTFVSYCFHSVDGYSQIGSYTGNVLVDGTIAYTGFRPALVLIKGNYSADWHIFDNKRVGYNVANYDLTPSENSAGITSAKIDFLSNGFKIRTTDANINSGGNMLVYYAIAESPFKYSNAR